MLSKKFFFISFAVIILIAMVVRFYHLGEVPFSLYWDEAAMLVDAKSVATSGRDMHGRVWYQVLYPSYGDYKLPVLIWLASASVKLFGVSEFALRLPSAVAGIMTVVLAGLIARRLAQLGQANQQFQRLVQLATMVVVTISPWSVLFSRTAFEGHLAQMWLALSVWLALWTSKRWWLSILAVVAGGISTYTYFSVRFVWPVVWLGAQWLQWEWFESLRWPIKNWRLVKNWRPIGASVGLAVAGLLLFGALLIPMSRSPLYADSNRFRLGTDSVLQNDEQVITSNIYREWAGNTFVDRWVFHRGYLTARELFLNYSDHLSLNYLFMAGDPNLRHGTGVHGLFVLAMLPMWLLGIYTMFDKHKRVLLFLVAWWLVALLPASVPENTPHALRSLNALVPLSVMIGWGLATMGSWVMAQRQRWSQLVVGLYIVALLASTLEFFYFYFSRYGVVSAPDWQYGYREVAQQIYQIREEQPVYVELFDERFYLWAMIYGPYDGHEFQTWQSQAYHFKEFDGVSFSGFPGWNTVDAQEVIIAGRTAAVAQVIEQHQLEVTAQETVTDAAGEPAFLIIKAERP